METRILWKESTQKIFWGVIVIAVAGIINVLYDYVSYGVFIFELVAKYLPSGNSGLQTFFTSIHTLGFLAKAAVVVGYVLYLLGLTKNAFGVLMTSPAFSAASQTGAKKLRYAAVCNIRLMLMPIVVALIFGLLALIAFASLKGSSNPTWLLYVGGFVGIAVIICALVFMFFALVYPFIGWYQIMNGGPGDDSLAVGKQKSGLLSTRRN